MIKIKSLLIAIMTALVAVSVPVSANSALNTEAPAGTVQIKRVIVTLKDEDGVDVPAVLTYPESGINPYGPAIILHHGGPGGHPSNLAGAPRFVAEGMARQGYTALSILSRHSRFYNRTPIENASKDIAAAVAFLDNYGFEQIVLSGHSLGAIRVTRYLRDTDDPRIKALVLYAPTRDMPEWVSGGMGEIEYGKLVDRARAMVADGRGHIELPFEFVPESPPWPEGVRVGFMHDAQTWLNWWGPDADTYHTKLIAGVKRPILMLSGSADGFVLPSFMEEMKRSATSSSRVDTIIYDGGDHIFSATRDRAVTDTLGWLEEMELGPRAAVDIDLIDVKTEYGRSLSGVVYTPAAGGDANKPAFILLHGWSGDVLWSSNHWLGVRLAQAGYTAIAPRVRVSGRSGMISNPLESINDDLAAWVGAVEAMGYDKIIGEGHSAGGIWWTTYANSERSSALKGIVYLAPTRDMADYVETMVGRQRYEMMVANARNAVAEGRQRTYVVNGDDLPGDLRLQRFFFTQYPDAWLSYWGPDAKSVHTQEVAKLGLPTLSIAGSGDGFFVVEGKSTGAFEAFVEAAGPQGSSVFYDDGAPHSLVGWEDRVAADIVAWSKKAIEHEPNEKMASADD